MMDGRLIDTVLFDLDGTLLPMDENVFMKLYFEELARKCAAYGYDPGAIPPAVYAGIRAMVKNDGGATNEERFWQAFARGLGEGVLDLKEPLVKFYDEEFHRAKGGTGENPLAVRTVQGLRGAGYTVVLATNPMFPRNGVATRLSWIGLEAEDFDLITSYEGSHYCKPNPLYYEEILRTFKKEPGHCLMVGNNTTEDGCAAGLGMDFYLVTDNLINEAGHDLSGFKSGSFADCAAWLERLWKNA